jgi:methionine synthase I (cobalamin-dependent)
MNLLEELEARVVCGDGAMGTLLLDRLRRERGLSFAIRI